MVECHEIKVNPTGDESIQYRREKLMRLTHQININKISKGGVGTLDSPREY